MGVNQVTKRGKPHIEVRKQWPDGSTFRKYYPNKAVAKQVFNEIAAKELRDLLKDGEDAYWTHESGAHNQYLYQTLTDEAEVPLSPNGKASVSNGRQV